MSWGVALVGCGTVGGGTAGILKDSADLLTRKTGSRFPLCAVLDKDFSHARSLGLDEALFRTSLDEVLADPEVRVVIELAGGTGFAKTVVERALDAGKHVVTANKALLATFGPELFARARSQGLTIGYEASCAGAIPIVRTLAEDLVANRITALAGIVNGTCNSILSDMGTSGLDYATALKKAQDLGFAEADPFLDVSGTDSAHKLALLASVAFGVWVDWKEIPLKGLEVVTPQDLADAAQLNARIKLLARAEVTAAGFLLSVEPTVVPLPQPLAALAGPFNGILVHGNETGHLYFQGRGAGARPTASAVVSDLAALAAGTLSATQRDYPCWPDQGRPVRPLGAEASSGPWFVTGHGKAPEVIDRGSRADLEARGLRVFPWYQGNT
jgi:homoserine dehydrogenase